MNKKNLWILLLLPVLLAVSCATDQDQDKEEAEPEAPGLANGVAVQELVDQDLKWQPKATAVMPTKMHERRSVYHSLRNIASCANRYEIFRKSSTPRVITLKGGIDEHDFQAVDFYVDGKIIVDADPLLCQDGVHEGAELFTNLNEYVSNARQNNRAKGASMKEFVAYNKQAESLTAEVKDNLNDALAKSNCSFKNNRFETAFPEFAKIDKFWWEAFGAAYDTSVKDWDKRFANRPKSITKQEFIKRMSCLGRFEIKPASYFKKWKARYDFLNEAGREPGAD